VAPHPGAADCEAIGTGFLAQPVNALSSVAYAGAALWLVAAARRRRGRITADVAVFTALLAAEGIGSLLFHGPGDRASHLLHDVTLVGTLSAVAATDTALATGRAAESAIAPTLALTAAAGGVAAANPSTTNLIAAVAGGAALTAGAVAATRVAAGRGWRVVAAACLGAGAVFHVLGRTGGRWCEPSSPWQPHAAWHVLTAVALAAWGRAALVETVRPVPAARSA
jgi:hypothetical protein